MSSHWPFQPPAPNKTFKLPESNIKEKEKGERGKERQRKENHKTHVQGRNIPQNPGKGIFLEFLPPDTKLVQSDADFHVESDTNNDWERNPHISMKTKKKKTLENKLVGYLIGRGSYLGAPVLSLPKR